MVTPWSIRDPPAWAPWRRDSRPFERRDGDRLHYFVRVFAPSGFRHRVVIRWDVYDAVRDTWVTTDRILLDVVGGRADGFRGAAVKSNFMPGRWRVTAETEDGRALATLTIPRRRRHSDRRAAMENAWRLRVKRRPVDPPSSRPRCPGGGRCSRRFCRITSQTMRAVGHLSARIL